MSEQGLLITDEDIKPQAANGAIALRNPMEMLAFAVQNARNLPPGEAMQIIERLAAMKEREDAKQAENRFNEAMEAAQDEIGEVPPDSINRETGRPYPSYKAIIRAVKPVAKKHGFTLCFSSEVSQKPDEVIMVCKCSHRGGHTEYYKIPMPNDGKGAKGGGVMSKSHATIAATSFGRGTLLKMIFNLDIGDEIEQEQLENLSEHLEWIANSRNVDELQRLYATAFKAAEEIGDQDATKAIIEAKNKRYRDLVPSTSKAPR